MKFDYTIHLTRSGDKTYSVQVRDGGIERPGLSKPVTGLSWENLWVAIPRAIQQREGRKVAELKASAAKVPPPKDWVPSAAGQPTPVATPAPAPSPAPKPEPAPGTAPVATAPMPELTQVPPKRGPGRPPKQQPTS